LKEKPHHGQPQKLADRGGGRADKISVKKRGKVTGSLTGSGAAGLAETPNGRADGKTKKRTLGTRRQ